MDTKDILFELRTKKGLSQEELAELIGIGIVRISRTIIANTIPNFLVIKGPPFTNRSVLQAYFHC